MRGMGSLPLRALKLHVSDDALYLSMPELRASLSFPSDTLPFSSRGENRLYRFVVLTRFTDAGPLRVLRGIAGGFGVPNRRWVIVVVYLPTIVKGISCDGSRCSSTLGCVPLSPSGCCCYCSCVASSCSVVFSL